MPLLSARPPDPNIVVGELDKYVCRTVADCDHHLRIMVARLACLSNLVAIRKTLVDRDAILDRRLLLMRRRPR